MEAPAAFYPRGMRVDYPAMLYKFGTMLEWDGERFDYVIVTDQEEADIAVADGWSFTKPVAAEPSTDAPRRGRPPKKESE